MPLRPDPAAGDRGTFPLRTCVQVALGFVLSAAAFHALPHDPCAVLNPIAGVDDPLAMHQELLAKKAPGEIRVLCVGASLTFGFPYGLHASYATVLECGLRAVFPQRRITVKPIAKPAIDSTRVADMVAAVLRAEPDVILADFGGNEIGARIFLERSLVPDDWLGRLADHGTRSRILFARLLPKEVATQAFAGGDVLERVLLRLLEARPAQPLVQGLPVSARDRAALADRARQAMRKMAAVTKGAAVPLVFMTSPYDLAGSWPRGMVVHHEEVDRALLAYQRGNPPPRAQLEQLAAAHSSRPDVHFALGQVLHAAGETGRARAAFLRARDLDPAPLHTIGEVVAAITEEGRALGIPVWHPDAAVDDGTGIPDPACYLDPAHWNLEGVQRGAAYLAEQLAASGLLPALPEGWRDTFTAAARTYLERAVDAPRRAYGKAEMQRATAAYHMLFGNVRDAVFPLCDGVQWFTGIVESPAATMWTDWAARVLVCAAAAVGRVDDLTAGSPAERLARMQSLSLALWHAGRAGTMRAFVLRILDGESFATLSAAGG